MQFKYPEILWALLLLVIPIVIHLFQLRRFKKTSFTNVKLLKKVVSESRKSSTLKKWLLLVTRLGLIAGLVFAFAQPFKADAIAMQQKEYVFYLDNSFSMQTKIQGSTMLQTLVQEFIKNIAEDEQFTLLTNDKVYANVVLEDIKNELLQLPISSNQLTIEEIILAAETYFKNKSGSSKSTVLISDFQSRMGPLPADSIYDTQIHYIKPDFELQTNIAIDSMYLNAMDTDKMELIAELSSSQFIENTAVSLYDGDKLIAKTAAKFNRDKKATVQFSIISNSSIIGRVVISDNGLTYDNQFHFTIDVPEKIKVLAVGSANTDYLSKIFTDPEFLFTNSSLSQLNYGRLKDYNLVILNELEVIPSSLTTAIKSFITDGGSFILIPAPEIDIISYNQLTSTYSNTTYTNRIIQEIAVANVVFDHPVYTNVFEKKVSNFQFPVVNSYYATITTAAMALGLQNGVPFLSGTNNTYFFSASLSQKNSNFKNSPLIVPTFYNMGITSLKRTPLYSTLGKNNTIEIPISLSKDNILTLVKGPESFIPQQRLLPQKVSLSFKESPETDGTYSIKNNEIVLKHISFNYNRDESDLSYLKLNETSNELLYQNVPSFFNETQKANSINEFWKWFAILALLFVFLETIFQRLLK